MSGMQFGMIALAASLAAATASAQPSDEARLKPAWEALDANKDGKVALAELNPMMAAALKPHDLDADGFISLAEYVDFDLDPNSEGRIPLADNVMWITNLAYAGTSDPRQALDIYLPKRRTGEGPLPVLAYVHGGGWVIGSKIMGREQVMALANSGRFAVVSIGYRLAWQAPWPAQIDDVRTAIRWIKAHAGDYGFDAHRICAMGVSAGGQLVAKLGLAADDASAAKAGPYRDQSSRVRCVVSEASPTDLRNIPPGVTTLDQFLGGGDERADHARSASPVVDIDAGDPPFLIIHGNKDPIVPYQQAVEFDAALRKAGVPALFQTVDGGGHGGFGSAWPAINERIRLFLERELYDPTIKVPTDMLSVKPGQ